MEKKEATKVVCQSCRSDRGVKRAQKFLYVTGSVMFMLAIYGAIELVKDIVSLF
jgi:hypothetical protein